VRRQTLFSRDERHADTLYLTLFLLALVGWLTLGWWGTYRALGHRQGEAGQRSLEGGGQEQVGGGHAGQLNSHTEGGK
jgi:hypothetical protein